MGLFSLVIDILVLVLLGVTIFYASQLSRHLNVFRSGKADMERILRELGTQTLKAQEAISILERAANDATDELRQSISKGKGLSDELQLINEAGNSLAERLESLASRNRTIAESLEKASLTGATFNNGPSMRAEPRTEPKSDIRAQAEAIAAKSGFMIRDPDYEDDDSRPPARDMWADDNSDSLQSTAEKELAEALRRRKRLSGEL